MDRVIPVGNEDGGGRCRDGVEAPESSSPSGANRARSLYELWTIRDNSVTRFGIAGYSRRDRVNGYQIRMADVKWERASISITLPRLFSFGVHQNCQCARSTRIYIYIYVYAELFFDAVSHFCSGFSNKAAAAVYNALVHAIPPRARACTRVVSNRRGRRRKPGGCNDNFI